VRGHHRVEVEPPPRAVPLERPLRTALWFHAAEPIHRFVTTDGSQEQAAKEVGLPVQDRTRRG
jgi:hypothetical protein